jgi:tRNA-splicing ligase RtcB
VDGRRRRLYVHRKGATRSFGPGHPDLPAAYRDAGQPVLVGGTMGTASYILAGTKEAERLAFGSSCHGAGRKMSRTQAKNTWQGGELIRELGERGIIVKARTKKGAAEEAPGAYKDVEEVAEAAETAGLSKRVARVRPVAVIKG